MSRRNGTCFTITEDCIAYVDGNPEELMLTNPRSLAGIHRLTELKKLFLLSNATPEGLEELARLPNLRQLVWQEDKASAAWGNESNVDPSALVACNNLTVLSLLHTRVKNLDALCDMTQLEHLCLKGGSGDGRLFRLANLNKLTVLKGHCKTLGGIQAIGQLASLQKLTLHGVPHAADLSRLSALNNLQELDIAGERDTHMALPYLPHLQRLEINLGYFPCDPTAFACLPSLKRLHLNHWNAGDYSALAGAEKLSQLAISTSDALTTKGLERCTELKSLTLPLPPDCSDLSWLSAMPLLTRLRLSDAHAIHSLAVIGTLPLLTEMTILDATGLTSLADLPDHMQLADLTLDAARSLVTLEGVDRLAGLRELRITDLSGALDVTPLTRLPRLAEVSLFDHENSFLLALDDIAAYGAARAYDQLVECPELVDVRLDSNHRAAEIEAVLARRRKDREHVSRRSTEWVELMFHSPEPARTVPILLKAMVEILDEDEKAWQIKRIRPRLRQWRDATLAAEEILGEL